MGAARKEDGTVCAWGSREYEGDASAVQDQLTNVVEIVSAFFAFAARKHDGTICAWGDPKDGGDASRVQDQLTDVVGIVSTVQAFAARKSDGTVCAWGNSNEFIGVRRLFKNICQTANKKRKQNDSKPPKPAKRQKRR